MLCRGCRRRLSRGASVCDSCGEPLPGAEAPLELVLAGGDRVPLVGDILIGRAAGCTLQLADPSVSRRHARISADNGAPARIEDAGSSHGTYLDGRRLTGPTALHDGVRIELGDQELVVERRRGESEAGRTIIVRPGASLVVPALGAPAQASATEFGLRPRVRSGYALKRLEADEGRRRWVLRDLERDDFLRLSDNDAQLLALLDGSRDLRDLIAEAEARFGAAGPARLARLLADLGERGLLAGVEGRDAGDAPQPLWRRLIGPRERIWAGADRLFDWVYRARRLAAVHAPGAVARRRGGDRRAARVRRADRAGLRHAVRGRGAAAPRRRRLHRRAVPRRRPARARARPRHGLRRAARPARRA